jgi:hypothetical protein
MFLHLLHERTKKSFLCQLKRRAAFNSIVNLGRYLRNLEGKRTTVGTLPEIHIAIEKFRILNIEFDSKGNTDMLSRERKSYAVTIESARTKAP